jgi:glycosyltransferase involved in cell wall biosynthesis
MLSLILPAYNEALRLPPFLASVRAWLDGHYPGRYEVLVVDDGGHDGLLAVLEQQAAGWPQLRWLRHPQNLGKGAAVRTGILAAEGELLLFADADGATPIAEEARLAAAIRAGADVAVGSRLISDPGAERSRVMSRALGGRLFAGLARRLFQDVSPRRRPAVIQLEQRTGLLVRRGVVDPGHTSRLPDCRSAGQLAGDPRRPFSRESERAGDHGEPVAALSPPAGEGWVTR